MLLQQLQIPDGPIPTVTIVEVRNPPTPELSMIDVAVGAFGLTGVIMAAAVVAGLLAGVLFIWYRSRRAITIIEARGGQHDLFKA
ncbi:MAG TPA: hypothetical protein VL263_00760 [Vicinamibacterales bacterium]|nr:hypothetical protein [Vicinamibacterales bacterium]